MPRPARLRVSRPTTRRTRAATSSSSRLLCHNEGVNTGDAVIFFNFRPDRARQMTRVFTDKEFDGFEREQIKLSHFVTMTEYDPNFDVEVAFPKSFPQEVLADVIAENGLKQLHTAETEKYAHVTFFLNGGIEDPKPGEERVLVPSPEGRHV